MPKKPIFAIACSIVFFAQAAIGFDGKSLTQLCKGDDVRSGDSCIAFLAGCIGGITHGIEYGGLYSLLAKSRSMEQAIDDYESSYPKIRPYCVDVDFDMTHVRDLVFKEVQLFPDKGQEPACAVVFSALSRAFPCPR